MVMRILNTLYVTQHQQSVRYERGTLIVDGGGTHHRVPLNTLDAIILTGYGKVSPKAMTECIRRGIRVSALSRAGRIRFTAGGATRGNIHLRVAQYARTLDPEAKAAIARNLVAGKIQNSRKMLLRWSWDAPDNARWTLQHTADLLAERLSNLIGRTDLDAVRGVEGDASRRYFQGLRAIISNTTPSSFSERSRRPPRDPVNAALSYVYSLLTIQAEGALDAVGLDPQLGFLHEVRSGRPSLALDLVEEFRPSLADRFVVGAFRRRQLASDDFVRSAGGAVWLSDEGRSRLLAALEQFKEEDVIHPLLQQPVPRWSLLHVQSALLARHLRGDIDQYPPYIMAG